jgi:hypothetical protein
MTMTSMSFSIILIEVDLFGQIKGALNHPYLFYKGIAVEILGRRYIPIGTLSYIAQLFRPIYLLAPIFIFVPNSTRFLHLNGGQSNYRRNQLKRV